MYRRDRGQIILELGQIIPKITFCVVRLTWAADGLIRINSKVSTLNARILLANPEISFHCTNRSFLMDAVRIDIIS